MSGENLGDVLGNHWESWVVLDASFGKPMQTKDSNANMLIAITMCAESTSKLTFQLFGMPLPSESKQLQGHLLVP